MFHDTWRRLEEQIETDWLSSTKSFTDLGSCTLLFPSQLESFKQIIFLKSVFVHIVIFLTCLLNNSSPMSRTALCFLDSTRHFVSNSVLRFLQYWTNTVVPGDLLLSSFPCALQFCVLVQHIHTLVQLQGRAGGSTTVQLSPTAWP